MNLTKKIILLLTCICTQTITPRSLYETVSETASSAAGWFSKQESQTSAKEYEIPDKSPISLTNHAGSITVTTWNKRAIMVEAIKKGSEEQINNTTFSVTIKDEGVTITTAAKQKDQREAAIDFNLIVPRSSLLNIRTESGSIHLHEGVNNSDVQTNAGSITIENAAQNVIARAPEGSITLEQRSLPKDGSFLLEAKGDIKVVMPEQSSANLSAKTITGKIFSDLFVTIEPITTRLDKDAYKRMQHEVRGTLGSGGIPMTLETMSGTIHIFEM